MQNIQPNRAANEFIDLMNSAWSKKGAPSEWVVASIKKKFRDIEGKVNDMEKFELKGMLATFIGPAQDVHKYHNIALKLDYSSVRLTNYAASLRRIGQNYQSLNLMTDLVKNDPSNKELILGLVEGLIDTGRYEVALKYIEKLSAEDITKLKIGLDDIYANRNLLNKLKIQDSELNLYNKAIDELLNDNNVISYRSKMEPILVEEDGEEGELSYLEHIVYIKNSFDKAIELGAGVCERLAAYDLPNNFSTRVTVRFINSP